MPNWTTADIPDLTGKLAIVTGANSGLGLETTRALAQHGAKVIMACRSPNKAEAALADLRASGIPAERLELRSLDLSSLASIREFADGIRESTTNIDLLINNAGVMALPLGHTTDGFEMQIGTNHLGHFALTGRLIDRVLATPNARVVTVSSIAHRFGKIRFDDLSWRTGYRKWPAYGQSKLANLLFGFELQRRLAAAGHSVRSVAAHPGYAATNLQAVGPQMQGSRLAEWFYRFGNGTIAQDAKAGALPSLYAATATDVQGGEYFGPGRMFQFRGPPKRVRARAKAHDPEAAQRLWTLSTELTGVEFPSL